MISDAGARSPSAYCYRCGHLWTPKTGSPPKRCPRCHSSRWDVPERRVRACKFCGVEFQMSTLEDRCPSCGRRQDERLTDRGLHCNQCDYDWDRRGSQPPLRCPLCHSAEWNQPKAERLMCQQCGHVWRRQSESPVKCPCCQSRDWNSPSRIVRCQRCGHVWRMRSRTSDRSVSMCPRCKSRRWAEPVIVEERHHGNKVIYSSVNSRSARSLAVCSACGHRWYLGHDGDTICPACHGTAEVIGQPESTAMVLWREGGRELVYVTENGCGCVYLLCEDVPVSCRYIHEVLPELGVTMPELIHHVNRGDMVDSFSRIAEDMDATKDDYERNIGYFMKRLSLCNLDARILALHFTGMGPAAIARKLSFSEEEIGRAFERIMAAYTDSDILVDDTIFTEDPFRYY